MTKRMFLYVVMLMCVAGNAVADDEYIDLVNYRDALKKQIEAVDSEIARCEKSLKGWKVATVLGSVGAVASGIGIIAQSHQIKENKKVVDKISADAKEATETLEFIKKVQE